MGFEKQRLLTMASRIKLAPGPAEDHVSWSKQEAQCTAASCPHLPT
jgi:hypothetical protein